MQPLKFRPIIIGTIWGSEEWILSAMEGRQSIVDSSSGTTLSELVEKYGSRLVGEKVFQKFGLRFPLLVKYINARQQLSVQVHPDDEMARRKGLNFGKTEMWYVLDAEENSEILLGFVHRFAPKEFESIVRYSIGEKDVLKGEKTLEDVLNRFYAKKRDWYFIPAGTVHSIGAGLRILEIQQASDTTYRLYDFNRVDAEGKKRLLDVEDALEAIDFQEKQEDYVEKQRNVTDSDEKELARSEHFVSRYINICGKASALESSGVSTGGLYHLDFEKWGSFSVVVCTQGSGTLFYREDKHLRGSCLRGSVSLKEGDLYLLPAELGAVDIFTSSGIEIVESHLEV